MATDTGVSTVKIKIGELVDAFEVLTQLSNQAFSVVVALRVVQLARWAREHYSSYVPIRDRALEKLGEKDSEGKVRIPPEKMAEFIKTLEPDRAKLIDFDVALKLKATELGDVKITPVAMELLTPFLD